MKTLETNKLVHEELTRAHSQDGPQAGAGAGAGAGAAAGAGSGAAAAAGSSAARPEPDVGLTGQGSGSTAGLFSPTSSLGDGSARRIVEEELAFMDAQEAGQGVTAARLAAGNAEVHVSMSARTLNGGDPHTDAEAYFGDDDRGAHTDGDDDDDSFGVPGPPPQ